jgi:hypothetical protein
MGRVPPAPDARPKFESARAVKSVVCTKEVYEVDERTGNPLISLKYPVGDLAAMPSRKGRQPLAFYVCGLLR